MLTKFRIFRLRGLDVLKRVSQARKVFEILRNDAEEMKPNRRWSRSTDRLWLDLPNWSAYPDPAGYCKQGVETLRKRGYVNVHGVELVSTVEHYVGLSAKGYLAAGEQHVDAAT